MTELAWKNKMERYVRLTARYADKNGAMLNSFHKLAPFAMTRMKRHAASDSHAVIGWP